MDKKELSARKYLDYIFGELYMAAGIFAGYGIGYLAKTYGLLPKGIGMEDSELTGMIVGGLAALVYGTSKEIKRKKFKLEKEAQEGRK